MEKTEAANLVAEEFDASVFVYSGAIDGEGYGALIKCMQPSEKVPMRPNAFLLLTTNGGDADIAYQIARFFHGLFQKLYLFVPVKCKSAGTLLALGASEIIMGGVSELGPLDVQLMQRDEIGKRRSGLVVRTAFKGLAEETLRAYEKVMLGIKTRSRQTISFEVASDIAATIATGIMAPVYAKINPETLGNDLRDLEVARAYGERLIKYGKNATREAVRRLVEDYPSHGFIIDKAEATELFANVSEPAAKVYDLMFALGNKIYSEQSPCFAERLDTNINPKKEAEDNDKTT